VKSVTNAHVLFVPSWYGTIENPVHGSFFRDQALAVSRQGVRTGVVFPELRTLEGARPMDWPARRFQVTDKDDDGITTMRSVGWRIPWAKKMTRDLWRAQVQRLIKQYVRRHGVPDLIHAHCVHDAGVAALEAKQNWRFPYVVTEHFSGYDRDLLADERLLQARDVFLQADRIVAVSRKLAGDIKPYVGKQDIHVIPNLVDTDFFIPPPEPRRADPFRFLFVGFLTANKRVDDLLRAFAAAFGSRDDVRLEIVGDGVQRAELESLTAELGVGQRVDFSGMMSRDGVRAAMHRSHAMVSASQVETFGVILIEAMSTGLPVIVTRCGGPEEFVTDDVGRLVPLQDSPALQAAMAEVVANCDRWQVGATAIRAHAEGNFGERMVGARLIETYNSVIQQA
jgi:glycosyltransferase involved in cell wall biosynthesis